MDGSGSALKSPRIVSVKELIEELKKVKPLLLDASVALAWVLDNRSSVCVGRAKGDTRWASADLVPACGIGIVMAWHGGATRDLSGADVENALDQILATAASKLDTEANLISARDALANARSFQLTAYDAVYLDLARREGLPLATLDKRLRAAAAKAGIALLK